MSPAVAPTDASRRHPASFRDPHGYVFKVDGVLHRAVTAAGELDFQALLDTGLYHELSSEGLLVCHEEIEAERIFPPEGGRRVLRPECVPIVSYASEWTFSQLLAAALLTLDIQRRALRRGMSLRDASCFNVQFVGVRPVFIDTLSFQRSSGGSPWIAYRQFCEHFLAPLALLAWHGHSVSALWSTQLDGTPLILASQLLPVTSWLHPGIALHVHLHAKATIRESQRSVAPVVGRTDEGFSLRLADSLLTAIKRLRPMRAEQTVWGDYRTKSTYSDEDFHQKVAFVKACVAVAAPSRAIDLGANDGLYTVLLAEAGVAVTAVDWDAGSCEAVFADAARRWPDRINTARIDLANPTPSFGAGGEERSDFVSRFRCDFVLALALVHHLSIARQIPYRAMARFFAALGPNLIVEYVPVTDLMAARLLATRDDVVPLETLGEAAFLSAFSERFEVLRRSTASSSGRLLFWMRRHGETK